MKKRCGITIPQRFYFGLMRTIFRWECVHEIWMLLLEASETAKLQNTYSSLEKMPAMIMDRIETEAIPATTNFGESISRI